MTSSVLAADPVTRFGDWLAERPAAATQAEAIERIHRYEVAMGQLEAAQAKEVAELERLRLAQEAAQKIPKAQRGKGLGAEVGLARRETPSRGSRFLKLARTLAQDLPHTANALSAGHIREEHAQVIAKETEVLTSELRRSVDTAIQDRLGVAGPKELANEVRAHAQALDPQAAEARHRQATKARRVTCKPLGDGMAQLIAYGPAHLLDKKVNSLRNQAKSLISSGKSRDNAGQRRTRDQLMFDLFAEAQTGPQRSAASVDLMLMMTPDSLLAYGDTPAWLAGHGPIPAAVARLWLADPQLNVFLRRIFTDATGTRLAAMESKGRSFSSSIRKMLLMRDNTCRNPHCESPVIDGDHAEPVHEGGESTWANASGLCARCNQIKENRGWKHKGNPEELTVTTPTKHSYRSTPAPLIPGYRPYTPPDPETEQPPQQLPIDFDESPRHRRPRLSITQCLRC